MGVTPQEAMRKAIAVGLGLTAYDDPNPEEAAALILAALPEGWALRRWPSVIDTTTEAFYEGERKGAQQERERLLPLCSWGSDCECPIHYDLRRPQP